MKIVLFKSLRNCKRRNKEDSVSFGRTNFISFKIKFQRNNLFFKVYLHFLSGLNNIFRSEKRIKKNYTFYFKLIDNGRRT